VGPVGVGVVGDVVGAVVGEVVGVVVGVVGFAVAAAEAAARTERSELCQRIINVCSKAVLVNPLLFVVSTLNELVHAPQETAVTAESRTLKQTP
jgi:hypothetical protein